MNSYKSHQYPTTRNPILMLQEKAMFYYAVFCGGMLAGLMLLMQSGVSSWISLIYAIAGLLISVGLGNVFAAVKLKKTYAQIFFVGENVSLISVYDILFPGDRPAFPLRFTNPLRSESVLSFHFKDQIIVLKKEDWDDFESIWQQFVVVPIDNLSYLSPKMTEEEVYGPNNGWVVTDTQSVGEIQTLEAPVDESIAVENQENDITNFQEEIDTDQNEKTDD